MLHYDGAAQSLRGTAEASGDYTLSLPEGSTFPPGELNIFSRANRLAAIANVPPDGTLHFEQYPQAVDFGTLSPTVNAQLCQRVSPTQYHFSVYDGRGAGNAWSVRLRATDHLSCNSASYGTDKLADALVFGELDTGSGHYTYTPIPVDASEILVYTGATTTPAGSPATLCEWDENQGPLLMLPAGQGLDGETYTADLVWTLYDAP